jgi:DNA-binding MarR family transcriptional regulator
MDLQGQRDLVLLSELDRNGVATQRTLAGKLGVALGLTNLYVKRLARKGYIKLTTIPRNRIRYLLTPQGFAEKSRLTYQYMQYSLSHYREMRGRLKDMLSALEWTKGQRVAICGTGELAELAYLALREMNIDCVGFVDGRSGGTFLSHPVFSPDEANSRELDRVLIADFDAAAAAYEDQLVKCGIPRAKLLRLGLRQ